jgi:hypothetical protein
MRFEKEIKKPGARQKKHTWRTVQDPGHHRKSLKMLYSRIFQIIVTIITLANVS